MMYIPSGTEPPLVRAAEVQVARIKAEEEVISAMDSAALRDSLHTADINNLHSAVQRGDKVLVAADELMVLGAQEYHVSHLL